MEQSATRLAPALEVEPAGQAGQGVVRAAPLLNVPAGQMDTTPPIEV